MERILLIILICIVVSCVPPTEEKADPIVVDYDEMSHRQIRNLQDRRDALGIMDFGADEDATVRYLCANALASG